MFFLPLCLKFRNYRYVYYICLVLRVLIYEDIDNFFFNERLAIHLPVISCLESYNRGTVLAFRGMKISCAHCLERFKPRLPGPVQVHRIRWQECVLEKFLYLRLERKWRICRAWGLGIADY